MRRPESQRLVEGSLQDTLSSELRLPVWQGRGGGVWPGATPPQASALSALWPEAAPAQGRRGLGDCEPGSASAQRPPWPPSPSAHWPG